MQNLNPKHIFFLLEIYFRSGHPVALYSMSFPFKSTRFQSALFKVTSVAKMRILHKLLLPLLLSRHFKLQTSSPPSAKMITKLFIGLLLICAPVPALSQNTMYRGHWEKTWNVPSSSFSSATLGFAFSGYSDVTMALSASEKVYDRLSGHRILTIGGGNSNGRWTRNKLNDLSRAMSEGRLHRYYGVAFDIEEGDAGLSSDFENAFRNAKNAGLFVVASVSHTSPYDIPDGPQLMMHILSSQYVDIVSPMMYGGAGFGQCPSDGSLSTIASNGVPWRSYANIKADVVPSLWKGSYAAAAEQFLNTHGVESLGYISWC